MNDKKNKEDHSFMSVFDIRAIKWSSVPLCEFSENIRIRITILLSFYHCIMSFSKAILCSEAYLSIIDEVTCDLIFS